MFALEQVVHTYTERGKVISAQSSKGATLVEFAVVLPVLLLFLLGGLDLIRAVSAQRILEAAAHQAVTLASTIPGVEKPDTDAEFVQAKSTIVNRAKALPAASFFTVGVGSSLTYLIGDPEFIVPAVQGNTRDEPLRTQSMQVRLRGVFVPLFPFLGPVNLEGVAFGFRDPPPRVSMPEKVDCKGRLRDHPSYFADCYCAVGTWNPGQRKCACPTGANGVPYVNIDPYTCGCPAGKKEIKTTTAAYGVCCDVAVNPVCGTNATFQASSCSCKCNSGYTQQPDGSCGCTSLQSMNGSGRCECRSDLTPCGPLSTRNPSTCLCECVSAAEGGAQSCACKTGFVVNPGNANQCICDGCNGPLSYLASTSTCGCGCRHGARPKAGVPRTCECVPPRQENSGQCNCPAEMACGTLTYQAADCSCQCLPNSIRVDAKNCTCSPSWRNSDGVCQCDLACTGASYLSGCSCQCHHGAERVSPTECRCKGPTFVPNGSACKCNPELKAACDAISGASFNTTACTCACPSGQDVIDGSRCGCNKQCGAGYEVNAACQCVCRSGYVVSTAGGNICTNQPGCNANCAYDKDGNCLVCPE